MAKTNKILIFWAFISLLLLSCDPDEDMDNLGNNNLSSKSKTDNPKPNTPIVTKDCNGSTSPQTANNLVGAKGSKITYSNEPRFTNQWYLKSRNNHKVGINILPVWDKGYGTKQIALAVIDAAVDKDHPELSGSVLVTGFNSYDSTESHGTKVAGLIAARDNQQGIIGIVPYAKLYSYAIVDQPGDAISQAFEHEHHTKIAVYNLSIGYESKDIFRTYRQITQEQSTAMDTVTCKGFNGKGSSIVFAAGNQEMSARLDGYLQHYAVIAVNSIKKDGKVPDFPENNIDQCDPKSPDAPTKNHCGVTEGVNLWLIAPSGLETTANANTYKDSFNYTSSAAPLVTGAIALLRSEIPNLTWRDIKLILAESANKYDDDDKAQYNKSGIFYSDSSQQQTYSRTMGFGLLDVAQALALAQKWKTLPPMKTKTYSSTTVAQENGNQYSHHFIVNNDITFIESLVLDIEYNTGTKGAPFLEITISSPQNIKASITMGYNIPLKTKLLFNTFLGSSAVDTWKVTMSYSKKKASKVSLTFRGH